MRIVRRLKKGGIFIETLILLAGFGLIAEAFMTGTATYKLVNAGQIADGTVTGTAEYGFAFDTQFTPEGDNSIVFEQYDFSPHHQIGEHVPVIYDMADPAHALVNRFGALWFKTMVVGLSGFLIFMLGLRMRAARSL
jgi:hypothetical protein